MSKNEIFIVVDDIEKFNLAVPAVSLISAEDYFHNSINYSGKKIRIINLCNSYKYQSNGYYVSLLAESRRHKVFPDINTLLDMKSNAIISIYTKNLDSLIQRSLSAIVTDEFILSIYFGKNIAKKYDTLSIRLFNLFQAPLLRVYFSKKDKWKIKSINIISMKDVTENHLSYLQDFAADYFKGKMFRKKKPTFKYSIAILYNENEITSPSNKKAICNFIKAGKKYNAYMEIITKDDYNRIPYFDALFIRETTSVNHYTYNFAQRAGAESIPVIDDPESIIKCTNKVYLADLLEKNKIPTPKTHIITKKNRTLVQKNFTYPLILKQPDSSFSQGVVKVNNGDDFVVKSKELFAFSDIIIAQEFIPTEFDWRIGILNKEVIFACKYFMAKGHWQIVNWDKKGNNKVGQHETVDVSDVPVNVIRTALKSVSFIGEGLYGVDLKEKDNKIYVIEINDNPSIEAGVEDSILKNRLYEIIVEYFITKIENR